MLLLVADEGLSPFRLIRSGIDGRGIGSTLLRFAGGETQMIRCCERFGRRLAPEVVAVPRIGLIVRSQEGGGHAAWVHLMGSYHQKPEIHIIL